MSLVPLDSSLGEDFISVSADFCRNYPLLKQTQWMPTHNNVSFANKKEHHWCNRSPRPCPFLTACSKLELDSWEPPLSPQWPVMAWLSSVILCNRPRCPHLLCLPPSHSPAQPVCTVFRSLLTLSYPLISSPPSLFTTHVATRSGALCVQITPALEETFDKKNVTPEMIIQLFYNCAAEAITNVNECH